VRAMNERLNTLVALSKNKTYFLCLLLLVILFLLPFLKPHTFILHLLWATLSFCSLATAYNIVGGYAGMTSFGHAFFYGIGAYIGVVLYLGGVPIILCFLAGAAVAAISSCILYPAFKLRGGYFAIGTLALQYFMRVMVREIPGWGGMVGLVLNAPIDIVQHYYIALTIMIATIFASYGVANSRLGLGLRAIRDDEDASQTLGVNSHLLKLYAMVISALFTGLVGAHYGFYLQYINPDTVFQFMLSLRILFMPIIGGIGTVIGPIIGGITLTAIDNFVSYTFGDLSMLIYGLSVILVVTLMPEGIYGYIKKLVAKYKRLVAK